jgi:hypothetical protein
MVRQWEEFPVGPGDGSGEMHVTLSRKGEILVGAAAFEKWGEPEAAVLLFDKINSVIGLMPSNSHASNAYPLKTKAKARYRVVRAYRFCRHHGIKVDRTVAFNEPEIDEGVLVLNLKQTRVVGRG